MSQDLDKMLTNMRADSWSEVNEGDYVYDDNTMSPLTRLESYVDYCFEVYGVVERHLDRDNVQTVTADWGRRRGMHLPNKRMTERTFGKRVPGTYKTECGGHHVIFLAEALIGTPPEDDKGVGWKPCVRHELGHAIDHEQRGTSDHSRKFKQIMSQFGENNDGMSQHGYPPRYHR